MNAELEGYYLDGQTARQQHVRVGLTPVALRIIPEDGEILYWLNPDTDWEALLGPEKGTRLVSQK